MAKIALVTGYTSELGNMIANLLVDSGYIVYAGATSVTKGDNSSNPYLLQLDITSDVSCKQAVASIIKRSKKVDVLINVAGMTISGPLESQTSMDFKQILDVNVIGAFRLTKLVMEVMTQGYIINVSSLSGFMASPNYALYGASKHALQAFGWAAAIELNSKNIHVVTVSPGALVSKSIGKMSHVSARSALPILGMLLPLTPPRRIANKILEIINSSNPRPLEVMGRDAKLMYLIEKMVPDRIRFGIQKWLWQKQQ